MAVADEAGPAGLTMAAVARRLGSYTPMALYRHVSSKDGLIDLMLDHAIGEVELPAEPGPDWRVDLSTIAGRTWRMLMRHSWYAQWVHTRPPLGPNTMRRTEVVLEILTRRGASVADAMAYGALLDRHTFGSAVQAAEERAMFERYGLATMEDVAEMITELRTLAAGDGGYPILSVWMASPSGVSVDEQFDLGLTFLLDGIAARLPIPGD